MLLRLPALTCRLTWMNSSLPPRPPFHPHAPAAELAQCFRSFLCFFPFSVVEVLLPPTARVSCKFLPCLHVPGMKSWFIFFCTVKLLVLESRVSYPHQIVQDNASFHDNFDSGGAMLHCSQQNLEAVRQDSEDIFNHPPGAGKPVVKHPLFIV